MGPPPPTPECTQSMGMAWGNPKFIVTPPTPNPTLHVMVGMAEETPKLGMESLIIWGGCMGNPKSHNRGAWETPNHS